MNGQAGKGDCYRPTNRQNWEAGYERIFGKGNGHERKAKGTKPRKKDTTNRASKRRRPAHVGGRGSSLSRPARGPAIHATDRSTPAYAQAEARERRGLRQYKYG